MEITIEPVRNDEDQAEMKGIAHQVFESEMGILLPRFTTRDDSGSFHALARVGPDGRAVGTLSVVDTSGDHELHEGYGLVLPAKARVARFTRLAVLRPYRGLNIPLMLMLEAHRRFVAPSLFDYTWLLFDADRSASSLMCKWLAFSAGERIFASEYGRSRALLRVERAPASEQALRRAEQYVGGTLKMAFSAAHVAMRPAGARRGLSQSEQS